MQKNRLLTTIYAITLIDIIIGTLIYSFLPDFIGDIEHKEVWLSIIFLVYSFCRIISEPILGMISDSIGRRPVFLLATITSTVSNFFLLPKTLAGLVINRSIVGSTNSIYPLSQSIISDNVPNSKTALYLGYLEGIISLGTIIGPLSIAVVLILFKGTTTSTITIVVIMTIILGLINILLSWSLYSIRFKDTPKKKKITFERIKSIVNIKAIIKNFKDISQGSPALKKLLLGTMLIYAATGYDQYVIIFLSQGSLELKGEGINLILLYASIIEFISNTLLIKYVYSRINTATVIAFSTISGAIVIILYPLLGNTLAHFITILTLDLCSFGAIFGLISSQITKLTTSTTRGAVFGLMESLANIASLGSTLAFTLLAVVNIKLPYLFFAFCAFFALILFRQAGVNPQNSA